MSRAAVRAGRVASDASRSRASVRCAGSSSSAGASSFSGVRAGMGVIGCSASDVAGNRFQAKLAVGRVLDALSHQRRTDHHGHTVRPDRLVGCYLLAATPPSSTSVTGTPSSPASAAEHVQNARAGASVGREIEEERRLVCQPSVAQICDSLVGVRLGGEHDRPGTRQRSVHDLIRGIERRRKHHHATEPQLRDRERPWHDVVIDTRKTAADQDRGVASLAGKRVESHLSVWGLPPSIARAPAAASWSETSCPQTHQRDVVAAHRLLDQLAAASIEERAIEDIASRIMSTHGQPA